MTEKKADQKKADNSAEIKRLREQANQHRLVGEHDAANQAEQQATALEQADQTGR